VVMRDDGGMAILFDAMMFLTVMTIVSVSLLTILNVDVNKVSETQWYLEEVHKVMLRSTLEIEDGAPITLADATELCLRTGDERLRTLIEEQVSHIIEFYFEGGQSVEWLAELGTHRLEVRTEGSVDLGSSDYVSNIQTDGWKNERPLSAGHKLGTRSGPYPLLGVEDHFLGLPLGPTHLDE
jgi:hypothetical protein